MPSLGETTAWLRRQQRGGADGRSPMVMKEIADFGENPGRLRMLSYRPANLPAKAPLVLVLHGCTQRAESFTTQAGWLTLADRLGFVVVSPEQASANNSNRCFNWYEPVNARRGGGEAASIAAMVAHAIATDNLDPARVFITGLSAGGAMTSVMLATYPELFEAGAIVAGLPYGVAQNLGEALGMMYSAGNRSGPQLGELVRAAAPKDARLPRVAIWHGDSDHIVRAHNAADVASQWADAHGALEDLNRRETLGGYSRSVWRKPDSDTVLVESNLIRGLGHGTPLATAGPDGIGTAAPHMLEAGVSSSLEIARFWGLTTPAPDAPSAAVRKPVQTPEPPVATLGDQVLSITGQHVPPAVQDVIAKALKTAGLRR